MPFKKEGNLIKFIYMSIDALLFSVNKISFIAFLITGSLVIYQIYLIKKETLKKIKPKIPEFKEGEKFKNDRKMVVVQKNNDKKSPIKRERKISFVITLIIFLFFGLIILFDPFKFKKELPLDKVTPTPIIKLVASSGIMVYNKNWVELTDDQIKEIQPGSIIYIGIKTVVGADIDKARIRVNKQYWSKEDLAVKFNKEKNVFYREYLIATGEGSLKIEGQLHSKTEGWLGE